MNSAALVASPTRDRTPASGGSSRRATRFQGDEQAADLALMRRVQAGDTAAFELLYDRYVAAALRIASSLLRDRGRAEDAVQDAFLAIWRGRLRYRPDKGSVQNWWMGIVRNRSIDALRRMNASVRPPTTGDGDAPDLPAGESTQEQAIEREQRETLITSLSRLPEAQAEVIVLAFYGQYSHAEIAQLLSLPTGTVKGRIRLGLQRLHDHLEAAGQLG